MPTQIQGLVAPVYEPVVTVPSTSEVITEAALTDTALALANRIEYVRQLLEIEQVDPQTTIFLRDDFFGAVFDAANTRLDGDLLWRTTSTDSGATIIGIGGSAKNPGQVRILCAGTPSEGSFAMHLDSTSALALPFSFTAFNTAVFVVKVDEVGGNVADFVRFGLGDNMTFVNGGDDSLLIFRARATDPGDWFIIKRRGGVQTTTLNVHVFTDNVFVVWKIERDASTNDLLVYANGTLVHTVDAADAPLGSCNVGLMAGTSVADAGALNCYVDFIAVRATPNNDPGNPANRAGA